MQNPQAVVTGQAAEIRTLEKNGTHTPTSGFEKNARPGDTAADDNEIDIRLDISGQLAEQTVAAGVGIGNRVPLRHVSAGFVRRTR